MDPKYCWFITALLFVSCQKAAAIREQKKGRACLDLQQKRHHSMLSSSPLWKTKPLPPHHKAVMPSLQVNTRSYENPKVARSTEAPLASHQTSYGTRTVIPQWLTGHLFFLLILQVGSFVVLQAYTDKDKDEYSAL